MDGNEFKEKVLCDRYVLKEKLGKGGMGQVYLAHDRQLDRLVAIKEAFRIEDEDMLRNALKEASVLAKLKHLNLPSVHDYFVEDETPYIVMEFICGGSLSELFDEYASESALKLREKFHSAGHYELVLQWLGTMLDVVEFLHGQSIPIVHRDIKPGNIIFTDDERVVLIDFGLVKILPSQNSDVSLSRSILGFSKNYSPLEQHNGEYTSTEADIYALCATFYHLFTKTKPPDVLDRLAKIGETQRDPLPPAHLLNPHIAIGISNMLHIGMTISRDTRPKTIAELKQFLREDRTSSVSDDEDIQSRMDGYSKFRIYLDGRAEQEAESQKQQPWKNNQNTDRAHDEYSPAPPNKIPRLLVAVLITILILAGSFLGFYLYETSLFDTNKEIVSRLERAAADDFGVIETEWENYQKAKQKGSYFKWGLDEVGGKLRQKIVAFSEDAIEDYRSGGGKVGKADIWKKPQELLEKILASDPANKDIQARIAYLKGQQEFVTAKVKKTSFNNSQQYYQEAIRLNPKFGDPYFMMALTYIYGKGRDYSKALENVEIATTNGFPFDKRTKAVKGDCLQALADDVVKKEEAKLLERHITNNTEAYEFLDELEASLKTIREKYTAAKTLYQEAAGYGTVDKSLTAINTRLQKLDQGIDQMGKINLLADYIRSSQE